MSEVVDILIEHGTLLTLNEDRHIITDGAIAIRADRIVAVGKTAEEFVLESAVSLDERQFGP